jgi:DNA helicase HerA-like ATPase
LGNRINDIVGSKGYAEEVRLNLTAALHTRIDSLLAGWKKDLFNGGQTTPWENLFERNVVINLSYLGDDSDKAFTMAILLQFLIEYRQAQLELSGWQRKKDQLVHLALFEEAHRIFSAPKVTSVEEANPQAHVAEMFANLLAEIRTYGQGMMIVDQVPSKLVPDAIKNTNLKIVHRLVANDDRDALAGSMGLSPEQAKIINQLKVGQAIVYGDMDDIASWVRINLYAINSAEINSKEEQK